MPAPVDAPIALLFAIERRWPRATEHNRSTATRLRPVPILITLVSIALIAACSRHPQSAFPIQQATNNAPQAQAPHTCPQGHDLRQVPMLVGFPSRDMLTSVRRGEALLEGCIGNPSKPETAYVCETCKRWRTTSMTYWQPLPKEFGVESNP